MAKRLVFESATVNRVYVRRGESLAVLRAGLSEFAIPYDRIVDDPSKIDMKELERRTFTVTIEEG